MFETILVTLLVASLCGLIRAYGGFESILAFIRRVFRGKRGGQLGIGLLVGLMDIATANNTVAIVMAGPIAKEVAEEYGHQLQAFRFPAGYVLVHLSGNPPLWCANAGGAVHLRHAGLCRQRL